MKPRAPGASGLNPDTARPAVTKPTVGWGPRSVRNRRASSCHCQCHAMTQAGSPRPLVARSWSSDESSNAESSGLSPTESNWLEALLTRLRQLNPFAAGTLVLYSATWQPMLHCNARAQRGTRVPPQHAIHLPAS